MSHQHEIRIRGEVYKERKPMFGYKPTVIEGPHKTALDGKEFSIVRFYAGTKTLYRFPYFVLLNDIGVPLFTDNEQEAFIFKDVKDAFIIRDLLCNANMGWLRRFDFQIWINEEDNGK